MRTIKTLFSICLVAVLCFGMSSCGANAVDYNNKFITIMNDMDSEMTEMNNAMMAEDYAKAEEVRKAWDAKVEKALEDVKAAGDFKGDASFQEAVLSALTAYQGILKNDYKKLIEMRIANKGQELTAESIAAENIALMNINNAFQKAGNELNSASAEFESKYSK